MGLVPFRTAVRKPEQNTAQPKEEHLANYPDGKIGKMPYEGVVYRSPVGRLRASIDPSIISEVKK